MAATTTANAFRASQSPSSHQSSTRCYNQASTSRDLSAPSTSRAPFIPRSSSTSSPRASVSTEHKRLRRATTSLAATHPTKSTTPPFPCQYAAPENNGPNQYRQSSPKSSLKPLASAYEYAHQQRPSKAPLSADRRPLRISPDPPTLFAFASSFQTLLDSQAPVSSIHSANSELLSTSSSNLPPSTLPITDLADLLNSNVTPSTSSSSKSSFSSVSTSIVDNTAPMAGVSTANTPGLDLLGILAEEVDWDPQQRGTPASARLATLGHTLHSHHEAKQKLWAGQILGSLGLIEPDGSRRNSFSTFTAPLPNKPNDGRVKAKIHSALATNQVEHKLMASDALNLQDPLNAMTLTKRTALFYENLYDRLCLGIVPRAYIYPKLGRKSHDHDPTFAQLALSISLLGLLNLTLPAAKPCKKVDTDISTQLSHAFVMPSIPQDRRAKAQQSGQLRVEATQLIEKILSLRLSARGGGICFGQTPSLETILTSFFMSIALYNLQDASHQGGVATLTEWRHASFFRFCEAVTLAKILGLDQLGAAAKSTDESEEVKVWMLLVRAERWWAEQKPGYVCQMEVHGDATAKMTRKRFKSDSDDADSMPLNKVRKNESSPGAMQFLEKLGFGRVRDDLLYRFREVIDCWTGRCGASTHCRTLTPDMAIHVHDSLVSLEMPSDARAAADPMLVDLARQTLRAKLWMACLHHKLVQTDAAGPLRPDQPLHIALDTLDLLEDLDQLVLRSLPSGAVVGEAIHDSLKEIRNCVSSLPSGKFAGEPFSFEQIEEGDEFESPARGERVSPTQTNSTTITRAAQSITDNFDRFLHRVVIP